MADLEEQEVEMEETQPVEEYALVDEEVGEEGVEEEIPENFRGMSRAQMAALLAEQTVRGDSVQAIKEGLSELGVSLRPPEVTPEEEPPIAMPSFKLSAEQKAKIDERFLTTDKPSDLLEELLEDLGVKAVSSVAAAAGTEIAKLQERYLATNPDYLRWKPEVEKRLAKLPAAQRRSPGVRERLLRETMIDNIDVIREEARAEGASRSTAETQTVPGTTDGRLRLVPPKAQGGGSGAAPTGLRSGFVLSRQDPVYQSERRRAIAVGILPPDMGGSGETWKTYEDTVIVPKMKDAQAKRRAERR